MGGRLSIEKLEGNPFPEQGIKNYNVPSGFTQFIPYLYGCAVPITNQGKPTKSLRNPIWFGENIWLRVPAGRILKKEQDPAANMPS